MALIALVALDEWIATARLPEAFAELGVAVVALCKSGAPLEQSRYLAASVVSTCDIGSDMERLVAEHDPAAVIVCDESAVHKLYPLIDAPTLSPRLRSLLRRSLGDPSGYHVVASKWATGRLAEQLNLRIPAQRQVNAPKEAFAFAKKVGYPIILKRERSYGGMGCYVCRSDRETLVNYLTLQTPRVLRKLRHWPGLLTSLHRFAARGFAGSSEPLVAQRYHEGQLAFTTAVARNGVMLGGFSVAAERVHPVPTGASTVVKPIDRPELLQATEALIRQTGFSGFIGVDFILDSADGLPYLLEINPRATPVCRLGRLLGLDLCSLFAASFAGVTLDPATPQTVDAIALFPNEWLRSWRSPYLHDSYVDVPYDDPALLAHIYRSLPLHRRIMLAIGLRGTLPTLKCDHGYWQTFRIRSCTKTKTQKP
jgi:biotin carboxylase